MSISDHCIKRKNKNRQLNVYITYTKILLMGIWINLTKKPMKPMIAKPTAVAKAIFWNSERNNNIFNQPFWI